MTQNAWWEIISNLFERDELMGRLLERSFRQTSGWGEALLALALVWLAHRLSERLQQHAVFERIRWWVVRHSLKRLLFPFFMLIFGVVAQIVWQLLGFNSAWLRFLVLAAGWMMAIRLCLSLLHAVAPPYHWMDWLERTAAGGLWLCFVLWISGVDTWIINWLDGLSFSVGKSRLSVWTMFTGLLWVGVILLLMTWLARWLNTQLMKSRHIDINLRIVLSKIISSAAVVLSILIALPLVGIDLTVLSVFGGALGVGLGFGLQKIASNYVSGFIILADRSIRPGDRLTVNSFTGYVPQMTARFVVLRSAAGEDESAAQNAGCGSGVPHGFDAGLADSERCRRGAGTGQQRAGACRLPHQFRRQRHSVARRFLGERSGKRVHQAVFFDFADHLAALQRRKNRVSISAARSAHFAERIRAQRFGAAQSENARTDRYAFCQ